MIIVYLVWAFDGFLGAGLAAVVVVGAGVGLGAGAAVFCSVRGGSFQNPALAWLEVRLALSGALILAQGCLGLEEATAAAADGGVGWIFWDIVGGPCLVFCCCSALICSAWIAMSETASVGGCPSRKNRVHLPLPLPLPPAPFGPPLAPPPLFSAISICLACSSFCSSACCSRIDLRSVAGCENCCAAWFFAQFAWAGSWRLLSCSCCCFARCFSSSASLRAFSCCSCCRLRSASSCCCCCWLLSW